MKILEKQIFAGNEICQIILPWTVSRACLGEVYVLQRGSGGKVVLTGCVQVECIRTAAELRQQRQSHSAPKEYQQLWLQKFSATPEVASRRSTRKCLWLWSITGLKQTNLMLSGLNVRTAMKISRKYLSEACEAEAMPQMRLKSTAGYFLDKLSDGDVNQLREVCQNLDGKTITVGTTCSGVRQFYPHMYISR